MVEEWKAFLSLRDRVHKKGYIDNLRYTYVMNKAEECKRRFTLALEIGPDDGVFAEGFIELGYYVESLDIEPRKFPWPHHVMDIQTDYIPKKFDFIHAGQVLEHLVIPQCAMVSVMDMAKPNSQLIVSVPDYGAPNHIHVYNAEEFEKFISEFIDIEDFQIFHLRKQKQFLAYGTPKY